MAELIHVEPTKSHLTGEPDGFAWFKFDDGKSYHRKLDRRESTSSGLVIMSDHIDAVRSMADGKTYDSKSALYASYRADGNPQGIRYECVGNEDTSKFTRPTRYKAKAIEAVKRALGDL